MIRFTAGEDFKTRFTPGDSMPRKGINTDLSLMCGPSLYPIHKSVLAASSIYFKETFSNENENTEKISRILLTGVNTVDLENVISYLYSGKLVIPENELPGLLKVSASLKIDGIKLKLGQRIPRVDLVQLPSSVEPDATSVKKCSDDQKANYHFQPIMSSTILSNDNETYTVIKLDSPAQKIPAKNKKIKALFVDISAISSETPKIKTQIATNLEMMGEARRARKLYQSKPINYKIRTPKAQNPKSPAHWLVTGKGKSSGLVKAPQLTQYRQSQVPLKRLRRKNIGDVTKALVLAGRKSALSGGRGRKSSRKPEVKDTSSTVKIRQKTFVKNVTLAVEKRRHYDTRASKRAQSVVYKHKKFRRNWAPESRTSGK